MEALTQTVELMAADNRQRDKLMGEIMEGTPACCTQPNCTKNKSSNTNDESSDSKNSPAQFSKLLRRQRRGSFRAKTGVRLLHLHHLVPAKSHERNASGRLAVDPVFQLQPFLGLAGLVTGRPMASSTARGPCLHAPACLDRLLYLRRQLRGVQFVALCFSKSRIGARIFFTSADFITGSGLVEQDSYVSARVGVPLWPMGPVEFPMPTSTRSYHLRPLLDTAVDLELDAVVLPV